MFIFFKFRGVVLGFIIGRKHRSNSVPFYFIFYGTLKFVFYRGFGRVILHVSVFPSVTVTNTVFIGLFTA